MSSLCFSFSLLFTLFLSSSSGHSSHDDRKTLSEFKSLIAHDPRHSMANWSPANPLCNWTGITCTRRHQMDRIIALNLTAMDLQGVISPSVANLSFLHSIDLSNNALHGDIPPQLGRLPHLRVLYLDHNQLEGSIPSHLVSFQSLVELDLSFNNVGGYIPSVANLTLLLAIDLSNNALHGDIPPQLSRLSSLRVLYLDHNQLEGSIPSHLVSCQNLVELDLSFNNLDGYIPLELGSLAHLELLYLLANHLTGTIPSSLGNLSALNSLDISENNLTGSIPKELGLLTNLQMLHLDINELSGNIPTSLSNISTLIDLEISSNSLTDSIPRELGLLTSLQTLNLHANELSGSIPTSLSNIPLLCQISPGSIPTSLSNILNDGKIIAVKVFNLQNDQVEKSFEVECSVLQKVRHRNLVRIITSCSNLHFKGLVFEFMCNGSLEKHLYVDRYANNGEEVCELGLKARLDIAIDVAHAIEYLHWHCDIKPSNVLLDEDMTGHVMDFGIARLIGATSIESLTSTLALKGSAGYIPPEYGLSETMSTKGDVYSYGILLLEMLTKKRPISDMFVGDLNLHKWVNFAFPDRIKEIIDNTLFSELDKDAFEDNDIYKFLLSFLHVGLLCSKDSPEERPTMRDVVVVLETIRENLVGNITISRRPQRSISNLLRNTSATRNVATTSNDQSSSTF